MDVEIDKATLEKAIREKSQRIINLSAKISGEPADSRSRGLYWQTFNELSQTKKELKTVTKQYAALLKSLYKT